MSDKKVTEWREPDYDAAAKKFAQFCQTVAAMRHRRKGCAWMIEQTHESLRRYAVEEAYETVEAIDQDDDKKISEELGDMLLQFVLQNQIGCERGAFDVGDAIDSVEAKMRRRHPHVFEPGGEGAELSIAEIERRYEDIKKKEKKGQTTVPSRSIFADMSKVYPGLTRAERIGEIASKKIEFDWKRPQQVLDQVLSEVQELKSAFNESADPMTDRHVYEELGDVFFSLAQLCRHLQLDPEMVAWDGSQKFLNRFQAVEKIAAEKSIDLTKSNAAELEELWRHAKKLEAK